MRPHFVYCCKKAYANEVRCPKCTSTLLSANKKGFSGKKAVAGAILTGGVGLLAGTIGSNKIIVTCLNCGHNWRPGGAGSKKATRQPQDSQLTLGGNNYWLR